VVGGREAERIGLANACVPDAGFDDALARFADGILAQSWFSHRANKRLLRETDGLSLGAGLAHEAYRTEGRGPDMDVRIAAFKAKTAKVG
jgi:enoyl-CoA hydratase/carnithine racemase